MPCRASIVRYVTICIIVLFPIIAYGDPPPKPVTVVNTTANPVPVTAPNPLPVTGTVNVGNLGAATLPVSVTNFPATQQVGGTVTVGNFPAVQQVSVTNASSAPVLSRVLNGPGSSPFVGVLTSGSPSFQVPATVNGQSVQSLVVTQVSGGCTGIGSFNIALQDAVGGGVIASFLFPVGTLEGGFFPILAQQTQIYFSANHSVVLSDQVGPHGCSFDMSGYFVTQ